MNPNPDTTRRAPTPPAPLMLCIVSLFALHLSPLLPAATIDLNNTLIVKPAGATLKVVDYAATELQAHLQLVTGSTATIPVVTAAQTGKFPIYVGVTPPASVGISGTLAPEEARWAITGTAVWLYGNDKDVAGTDTTTVALDSDARTGSLFAVYEFLEKYAGVSWPEPGDTNTVFTARTTLAPANENGSWAPQLIQRKIRLGYSEDFRTETLLPDGDIPAALKFSPADFAQRSLDERVWMRRHRMGSNVHLSYGHNFTKWWGWYGRNGTVSQHPEWFAMNTSGNRPGANPSNPDRLKLCVSNPDLQKQVALFHFTGTGNTFKAIKDIGYNVNAIENDSRGFCNCPNCKALDVVLPGEENLDIDDRVVTDRYVHFVNKVLEEARKIYIANYASDYGADPNPGDRIKVLFYAYSRYSPPPRRENLAPGIFLFLVPNLGTPLTELDQYFADWKARGASEFFHRPNDLNQDTGLPLGFEYHMFEKYRLGASRLTLKGTDYDMCWDFWPVSGITYYIMARAMYRPEKTFAYWENEYLGTYGPASADIRAYHAHWRQIWNQRIMNNRDKIDALAKAQDISILRTKVTHLTDILYSENDFNATDAMLAAARTRPGLTTQQRARVENLQLANQHNRLKYRAVCANRLASPASDAEKRATTQALYDFRVANKASLNIHWEALSYLENLYEDNTGTRRLFGTEDPTRKAIRLRNETDMLASRQTTTLDAPPAITGIAPAELAPGGTLTITGANLYDIAHIRLGDTPVTTWTRVDATTITLTLPDNAPATGAITLTTRAGDRAHSPLKYNIIHPITTLRPLTDQTVAPGCNLTLTADTDGYPAPTYAWEELAATPGATWTPVTDGGKYTGATTALLRITGLDPAMTGNKYRYTATNPNTPAPLTSNPATLTVQTDTRYPHPAGIARDTAGNLYIADNALRTIQRITTTGTLAPFAGSAGTSGTANGAATAARFMSPVSLAIAPGNQLVIADNEAGNLRLATAAAAVTTLAANLAPAAIATDASGNTYVADTAANCIRMVTLSGLTTTIAGSPAGAPGTLDATGTAARFNAPAGIAIDATGTLYVADTGNHTIRAIAPNNRAVTTIAGLPTDAACADGDALTEAAFNTPRGLATNGNALYIADTGNSLIRKLDLATSTVTTIAGRKGDAPTHGYQAAAGHYAIFDHPQDLAIDAAGNLYVADTNNAAIRKISTDGTVTTLAPPIAAGAGASAAPGNNANNSGGGGGGGAPTPAYLLALLTLILIRRKAK